MAYYQGDYYQGDYYQGDPFLGSMIAAGASWLGKRLFKRKLTTVGQQALARKVTGGLTRVAGGGAQLTAGAAIGSIFTRSSIPIPFTQLKMTPGAMLPGGQPFVGPRQPAAMAAPDGGCCPSGFHFNKSISHAKDTWMAPPGTICVRNRSMNVANPRALRRGLRRVAGFGKLAQRSKKDIRRAAKAIGA